MTRFMDFRRLGTDVSPGNPDVTWVGGNPFEPGFCLGFDNGGIMLLDITAGREGKMQVISPTGDAINGVASIGTSSLAVSTRSEVSFIQLKGPGDHPRANFPGGAHGVVATRSGYFIAPLGAKGLLVVKPTNDYVQPMGLAGGGRDELYFYRMAALSDGVGKEILIFANRKNGVGVSDFNGSREGHHIHTMGFEGGDVVDVCGIAPNSLAAIAITKTAELLWIRDSSKRDDPIVTKLSGLSGHIYRVLATPDHLFVLSSKALYVWPNIVARARDGRFVGSEVMRMELPVEAADMSVIDGKWLALVMGSNAISVTEITDIEKQLPRTWLSQPHLDWRFNMKSENGLVEMSPVWKSKEVEQEMACV